MAPGKENRFNKKPDYLEYRERKIKYLNHISTFFATRFNGFKRRTLDKIIVNFVLSSLKPAETEKVISEGEIKLPSQIQKEYGKRLQKHPYYRFDPDDFYPFLEVSSLDPNVELYTKEERKERRRKNRTSWTERLLDDICNTDEESPSSRIYQDINYSHLRLRPDGASSLAREHQEKFGLQIEDVYDLHDTIVNLQKPVFKVFMQKLIWISADQERRRIKKAGKKHVIYDRWIKKAGKKVYFFKYYK